jgi:hypothetical protein
MILCHQKLIEMGLIGQNEKKLLEAWLLDINGIF